MVRKKTTKTGKRKTAKTKQVKGKPLPKIDTLESDNPDRDTSRTESIKIMAWQMRRLGYTVETVAMFLGKGTTTIKRWDKELKAEYADLPGIRAATDMIQTMIPRAARVLEKALAEGLETVHDDKMMRIALDAATKILITHDILRDKITVERDDVATPDSDLVAEAESIIAGTSPAARGNHN